jgi:hypothetical protein
MILGLIDWYSYVRRAATGNVRSARYRTQH